MQEADFTNFRLTLFRLLSNLRLPEMHILAKERSRPCLTASHEHLIMLAMISQSPCLGQLPMEAVPAR